jgi:hypothetical protein
VCISVLSVTRRHVQIEHGVLFYHLAVRRVLSDDNVAPVHETSGGLSVHHRGALRRTDACHGRRVLALAVGFATDVLGAGAKPIQKNDVHLRRGRSYMFFVHAKSRKSRFQFKY